MRSTTIACVRDVTADVDCVENKKCPVYSFIHSFTYFEFFIFICIFRCSPTMWSNGSEWGYKCVLSGVTFVVYALYFCERQTTIPYSLAMEQWVKIVVQLDRTIAYDFATTNDDSESKANSKIITQTYLMLAKEKCVMCVELLSLCCCCCCCYWRSQR